jgi:broad specificity phosphatase PhoE
MHLFIIRHGECLGQCDPAYYADPDSPLSPRGAAQARAVAYHLRTEQPTHILSSPLLRSLATAHSIADTLDHASVDVWFELREAWDTPYRSVGRAALQQRFPRARLPASMLDAGWEHAGDKTYESFLARATSVFEAIKTRFSSQDRIVIVTHGGFANALLHTILQIAPTTPQWFELANGSLSHIRLVAEPEKERPNWPLYPPVHAEVLCINSIPPGDSTMDEQIGTSDCD